MFDTFPQILNVCKSKLTRLGALQAAEKGCCVGCECLPASQTARPRLVKHQKGYDQDVDVSNQKCLQFSFWKSGIVKHMLIKMSNF